MILHIVLYILIMNTNASPFPGFAGADTGIPGRDDAAWQNPAAQQEEYGQAWQPIGQGDPVWVPEYMSANFVMPPSERCPEGSSVMFTVPMRKGQETSFRFTRKGFIVNPYSKEPRARRKNTAKAPRMFQHGLPDMGGFGGEAAAPVQVTDANANWDPTAFDDLAKQLAEDPYVQSLINEVVPDSDHGDNDSMLSSSPTDSNTSTTATTVSPVMQTRPPISEQTPYPTFDAYLREKYCPESPMVETQYKLPYTTGKGLKRPRDLEEEDVIPQEQEDQADWKRDSFVDA